MRKQAQDPGRLVDSHADRLLRDLIAIGHVETKRSPVTERLAAKLGEDLFRALLAELDRLDSGALPIHSRSQRVA